MAREFRLNTTFTNTDKDTSLLISKEQAECDTKSDNDDTMFTITPMKAI